MILKQPSDKPKLIVHVGPGKTGTSAIQKWLSDSRDQLRTDGYLYPDPDRPAYFDANGDLLCELLATAPNGTESLIEERLILVLNEMAAAAHINACHTVILSNELLCNTPRPNLEVLKRHLAPLFDFSILMVVRDPWSWMWSSWVQGVKRSALYEEFSSYAARDIRIYSSVYENFLDVFSNIILIPYSKSNLIKDISQVLGLDSLKYDVEPWQGRIVNRSLTQEELEILLCVNAICREPAVSKILSDYMIERRPNAEVFVERNPEVDELITKAVADVIARLEAILPNAVRPPRMPIDGKRRSSMIAGFVAKVRAILRGNLRDKAHDPVLTADPSNAEVSKRTMSLDLELLSLLVSAVRSVDSSENHLALLRKMLQEPPEEARYEGHLPANFSSVDYLILNQDVLRGGSHPIAHYLNYGMAEGRVYRRCTTGMPRTVDDVADDGGNAVRAVFDRHELFWDSQQS